VEFEQLPLQARKFFLQGRRVFKKPTGWVEKAGSRQGSGLPPRSRPELGKGQPQILDGLMIAAMFAKKLEASFFSPCGLVRARRLKVRTPKTALLVPAPFFRFLEGRPRLLPFFFYQARMGGLFFLLLGQGGRANNALFFRGIFRGL